MQYPFPHTSPHISDPSCLFLSYSTLFLTSPYVSLTFYTSFLYTAPFSSHLPTYPSPFILLFFIQHPFPHISLHIPHLLYFFSLYSTLFLTSPYISLTFYTSFLYTVPFSSHLPTYPSPFILLFFIQYPFPHISLRIPHLLYFFSLYSTLFLTSPYISLTFYTSFLYTVPFSSHLPTYPSPFILLFFIQYPFPHISLHIPHLLYFFSLYSTLFLTSPYISLTFYTSFLYTVPFSSHLPTYPSPFILLFFIQYPFPHISLRIPHLLYFFSLYSTLFLTSPYISLTFYTSFLYTAPFSSHLPTYPSPFILLFFIQYPFPHISLHIPHLLYFFSLYSTLFLTSPYISLTFYTSFLYTAPFSSHLPTYPSPFILLFFIQYPFPHTSLHIPHLLYFFSLYSTFFLTPPYVSLTFYTSFLYTAPFSSHLLHIPHLLYFFSLYSTLFLTSPYISLTFYTSFLYTVPFSSHLPTYPSPFILLFFIQYPFPHISLRIPRLLYFFSLYSTFFLTPPYISLALHTLISLTLHTIFTHTPSSQRPNHRILCPSYFDFPLYLTLSFTSSLIRPPHISFPPDKDTQQKVSQNEQLVPS